MAPRHKLTLTAALISAAGLCVLIGAGAVFYAVALGPLQASRRSDGERCGQLRSLLRSSQQTLRTQRELTATLTALTADARAVRARVPEHSGEAELLGRLTEIAGRAGVSMVDYRRGTIVESEGHCELRVGIKCEGTFEGLCRLLRDMEDLERIVVVEQLRVTPSPTGQRYPADLTLLIFFGLDDKEQAHG